MVTNAGPQAGTWNSLASGSVTPNEQSGDTGQFTISSVTYQVNKCLCFLALKINDVLIE